MPLSNDQVETVYKLYDALMEFTNEHLHPAGTPQSASAYASLGLEKQTEIARAFVNRLDLIDAFIAANPREFSPRELEIVSSWRHLVSGRFIALRQLKQHLILLACDGSQTVYGVLGLSKPMAQVIPQRLPAMIETVLLPFQGQLVYNGTIGVVNATFGPGARRAFEDQYRAAKASQAVVVSLPNVKTARPAAAPAPRGNQSPRKPVPDSSQVLQQLNSLIDGFCQASLNEEYAELCRKLAKKLAAQRPSPLLQGKLETWACGIIRTIGWVNFLDDRSQSPHLKLPAIDRAFGVAESTGQGKAKLIRQKLKIHQFDHRWILPSRWESTLMIWTLQDSNGYMIDIRQASVATQRAAFKQGLIPYVPADRAAAHAQALIAATPSRRLFQFKITLRDTDPAIWRRIQVFDDTLDKLHEHIQLAMGWTNSHLHEFMIEGRRCGDPELLDDDVEPFVGLDSTQTPISAALPAEGAPFTFVYHYDFGDSWLHDMLWEGCPSPQPGVVYPQCLEGERACPPEDVGGPEGFRHYLETISNPNHEEYQAMLDWREPYNPNAFTTRLATHLMQEGSPNWRKMT
jgi:hypothetical protein